MVNDYLEFKKLLETLKKENKKPTLLLHSCCGPCSSYVLKMLKDSFDITIYYYNPNIFPEAEFDKRALVQQELIDKIPCEDSEESLVDKIHLSNIISALNERERKIIVLRYFRDKTQSEIAETLGVSQVQVSRLENKIIDKIKKKY